MVDGSEERRERFSRAGRREDEHALAIRYCGPGELLRAGRGLERGLEPRARPRVKARERITPHGDDATSAAPSAHRSEDNKRGPRCGPLSMRCLELRGPHGSVHMSLPSPPNAAERQPARLDDLAVVAVDEVDVTAENSPDPNRLVAGRPDVHRTLVYVECAYVVLDRAARSITERDRDDGLASVRWRCVLVNESIADEAGSQVCVPEISVKRIERHPAPVSRDR